MTNEKQHIVPAAYLKSWSDPNAPKGSVGSVWVIPKANPSAKTLEPPTNYFCAPDVDTRKAGGGRNLVIENVLAEIEGDFGRVKKKLEARQAIEVRDRAILSFFCAGMLSRTATLADSVGKMFRDSRDQAARLEASERIEPTLSKSIDEHLRDLSDETVRSGLLVIPKMLFRMHLSIVTTDDEAGFVTGDDPALVCSPGHDRPFLGHPDAECTVPLTPHHTAFYSWKVKPMLYPIWTRVNVDRINSRTIGWCSKEFVSWKGIVRPEWLEVH